MQPLAKFRHDNREVAREDFLARFDHPFLWMPARDATPVAPAAVSLAEVLAQKGLGGWLFEVKRRPENRERSFVSLGREDEADVKFSAETVSKKHAYLVPVDGAWCVADAGSRNGSFLNGRTLGEHVRAELRPGDQLRFGTEVVCYFLPPEQLFSMLRDGS